MIDIVSDGASSGKTQGTDLREGVPTLPTILLNRAAEAGDESARQVQTLIEADLSSDDALAAAVSALAAHPVTQEAWQIAYDWADRAIAAIAPLPDSTAKARWNPSRMLWCIARAKPRDTVASGGFLHENVHIDAA